MATTDASTQSDLGHPVESTPAFSPADWQELPHCPSPKESPLAAAKWLAQLVVGVCFLLALLAVAAATPVVNVLALGYLMTVQARVARSGKLRSAFYLVPGAIRLGSLLLGIWLWLSPVHLLAEATRDSWLIAPGARAAWLWTAALIIVSVLISVHILMAIACGGGWRFVRPLSNARRLRDRLRQGGYWQDADRSIREFVAALEWMRLLRLGLLGLLAAYLWLALPIYLFTMLDDVTNRAQVIGFLSGALALTVMLPWMPMLLAHVAVADRWSAIFELKAAGKLALGSPFRWLLSTAVLMACSVAPMLYVALLKNRIPPHAAQWDAMLVFLATVVPARALIGWAYHRALQRADSGSSWRRRGWQAINVVAMLVASGYYVYFLNLAAVEGELGRQVVWQLHFVLLPFPL